MKKMKLFFAGLGITALMFGFILAPASAGTSSDRIKDGVNVAAGKDDASKPRDLGSIVKSIINILSVVIGAIAVIMLMFGGFRYVTSAGNDTAVQSAKNTILYAIIGLVIVALAQVMVQFVLGSVGASEVDNASKSKQSDLPEAKKRQIEQ